MPMEVRHQARWIGPIEFLFVSVNVEATGYARMGFSAWTDEHSTRHDCRKRASIDQRPKPRLNEEPIDRVLSTGAALNRPGDHGPTPPGWREL